MSTEYIHERRLPARILLVEALIHGHRKLVLSKIGQIGLTIASWDELLGHTATEAAERLHHPDNDTVYWSIHFGGESLVTTSRIEALRSNPVHPISILGADGIQLIESGEVLSYTESANARRVAIDMGEAFKEGIDSKAKYLDVRLLDSRRTNGFARIFMAPELPPAAIHWDDLEYLDTIQGNLPYTLLDTYDAINYVEKSFGSDAVEYLNDSTCEKLISAIESTPKKFVME